MGAASFEDGQIRKRQPRPLGYKVDTNKKGNR